MQRICLLIMSCISTISGISQVNTFPSTGNVGIGTSNPTESLDVRGILKLGVANNQENNSPGIVAMGNDDFLYDGQYINHYGFGFHGYNDGTTEIINPRNTYVSGYFGIDFFTSGRLRMRISNDGLVSIGTPIRQPGYRLAVNGKIRAKEIKVETNWSDFVFEENYNLPSLQEVEKHIQEKGHLKDIPSAKEVGENGIYLGEMNAKLLQKIEELTLYTIDQQKMIHKLNTQNESQFKMIKDLKEELDQLKERL